jgi:hypothetical protein
MLSNCILKAINQLKGARIVRKCSEQERGLTLEEIGKSDSEEPLQSTHFCHKEHIHTFVRNCCKGLKKKECTETKIDSRIHFVERSSGF